MERRMLLAVILSFLVVTLYSAATGRCTPPEKPTEDGTQKNGPVEPGLPPEDPTAPRPGGGTEPPPRPGPGAPGPDPAPVPAPGPPEDLGPQQDYQPAESRTVVRTAEYEAGFSSQGGALEYYRLLNAFEADKKTPLDLVVPEGRYFLMGVIEDTFLRPGDGAPGTATRREDPAGPLRRFHWTRDEAAERATPEQLDVVYTFTTADGTVWVKRWILVDQPERFDFKLMLSRRVPTGGATDPVPVTVLATAGLLREPATGASYQYPNVALVRGARMSEPTDEPFGMEVAEGADAKELRQLGARSHYYLSTFFADPDGGAPSDVVRYWGTGEEADQRPEIEASMIAFFEDVHGRDPAADRSLSDRIKAGAQAIFHNWVVVEVPSEAGQEAELSFYVGPIDRAVLRQEAYASVKPVIKYVAAPDILADALLGIYDIFRGLFGSAGLGVILMTLVVRGLMMPLSIRNQLSMRQYSRKIAKLKPKLDQLKKKFGSNVKKMREEQAKLYREHNVGVPTGCLMMFVQIPIFFALFSSLRSEYTLRNSAFGWIHDLGSPDKLVDFGHIVFDIGVLQVFSINILPLLMVGLSLWQQRLMPKPADEQQAQQMRMMKWLPIVFAVILYNYTAALALYMVLSSAVSIVESRIVRAKDKAAEAAAQAAPA